MDYTIWLSIIASVASILGLIISIFRDQRLIIKIILKIKQVIAMYLKGKIDDTYEIQIRTILSEGWHEVEHDLRYKCQQDWNEHLEESRLLNGIYATLESSEWSMLTLFDRLAYAQYKKGAWNAMMRNKMRLRFADKGFSKEIIEFLSKNKDLAKKFFRVKRSFILKNIMEKKFSYPLTYDTVLHLLNHIEVKNKKLADLELPVLRSDMELLFGTIE